MPNRYDIYVAKNDKLILQESVFTKEQLALFCRECSEQLSFAENDAVV